MPLRGTAYIPALKDGVLRRFPGKWGGNVFLQNMSHLTPCLCPPLKNKSNVCGILGLIFFPLFVRVPHV